MRGDIPDTPGVYTLIIKMKKGERIRVGQLGSKLFPDGHYSYTGSALGSGAFSLSGRIRHHLRPKKFMHWHIDYLLNSSNARVEAVVFSETDIDRECEVSKGIMSLEGAEIVMRGFGASDCKAGCVSHLHYFRKTAFQRIARSILQVYERVGLRPHILMLKK